jgi:hypothetical protein
MCNGKKNDNPMLHRVVWWILTDVSEELSASIIGVMSKPRAEMMR